MCCKPNSASAHLHPFSNTHAEEEFKKPVPRVGLLGEKGEEVQRVHVRSLHSGCRCASA